MELLLLALLAAVALGAVLARRRHQIVEWDRELQQAFGAHATREIASHRRL